MKPTPSGPSPASFAMLQNLSPFWHGVYDKLGLNLVLVTFDTQSASPIHRHPQIEIALGLELQQIGAGYYESSFYPGCHDSKCSGSVWHMFFAHNLGAAMSRIKSQVAVRGLLNITNIAHAEECDQLRVWWSYEPESIGKLFTFES